MTGLLLISARTMTMVLVFIPIVFIALFISLNYSEKNLPDSAKVLPIYLIALAIQLLHFAEEYVTDFDTVVPELFGLVSMPLDDLVIFNMVAYALFILGGIVLYRRMKMFMIVPLFFIIAAVFMNTIAHIGMSIWQMNYVPGLLTVLLYIPLMPRFKKQIFPN